MTSNPLQIEELLSAYLSEELSEEGAEELLRLWESDESVRERLAKDLWCDYLLRLKYKGGKRSWQDGDIPIPSSYAPDWDRQIDLTPANRATRPIYIQPVEEAATFWQQARLVAGRLLRGTKGSRNDYATLVLGLLTLAGTVLCMLTLFMLLPSGGKERSFDGIVRIGELVDAQWQDDAEEYRRGQILQPGELALESGRVKLEFKCGADVIMQGPCRFMVAGPMSNSCLAGRLSIEVPKQVKGFEIVTPFVTVVDRGTAFSVNVMEKAAAVEVAKGKVELYSSDRSAILSSLSRGMAATLDAMHDLVNYEPKWDSYLPPEDFEKEVTEHVNVSLQAKRSADRQLKSNPNLLIHFDAMSRSGKKIPNASEAGATLCPELRLVHCPETEGRWHGTNGLAFKSHKSFASFDCQQEFTSLTLVMSVQIDQQTNQASALFVSDTFYQETGGFLWQLTQNGQSMFYITTEPGRSFESVSAPFLKRNNRGGWFELAIVVDGETGTISHYVDGRLMGRTLWSEPVPLKMQQGILGNILDTSYRTGNRNFIGTMDEFKIFDRAIPPKQQ
ncbi:MAG: LamG-like jellyroll fold domain-containing protein [Planctomycetia bacterium]|nr:LamG-like jellyroll fold domain-containing protein [Planctomycetia bacterium]